MSVASWVDVQAGRLVARSNWDRYTPRVRVAWAVVCWLVGLTVTLVVLAVLKADMLFIVVWTVAVQSMAGPHAGGERSEVPRPHEGRRLGRIRGGIPSGPSCSHLNRAGGITTTPERRTRRPRRAWSREPGHLSATLMVAIRARLRRAPLVRGHLRRQRAGATASGAESSGSEAPFQDGQRPRVRLSRRPGRVRRQRTRRPVP